MSRKLGYEDYLRFPDDGRRHEIIDGRHYIHDDYSTYARVINRFRRRLLKYDGYVLDRILMGMRHHVRETLGISPCDDFDIVHLVARTNDAGVAELVIEVRDEGALCDLQPYLAHGAQEFWAIDCERETVEVFHRENDRFVRIETGDPLTTPLLPGFALPLADVFA